MGDILSHTFQTCVGFTEVSIGEAIRVVVLGVALHCFSASARELIAIGPG